MAYTSVYITHLEEKVEAAKNYVAVKKGMTLCLQKQFRQLCNRCKNFAHCELYDNYVETWMKLQEALKR